MTTSTKIHHDDLLLVRQALSGSHAAFRRIVETHEQSVARTVKGMLGSTTDAEDVGQETFIRFYHAMKQYKGEASLKTYLTRIAINLSLNQIKKRNKRRWISMNTDPVVPLASEDVFNIKDEKEELEYALEQLDPEFRSVVVIRLIQGYTTKETAEMLDIPQGTVLSRLSRAQQKLKEILNTKNYHDEIHQKTVNQIV